MARSTGIVLTAGALGAVDLILTGYQPDKFLKVSVGTVAAALISAGLDKVIPGFGTGAAAVLLATVLFTSGPRIVHAVFPMQSQGFGSR